MPMFFNPFMVPITLFVVIGAVLVLRGPLGRAMADRIAGRPARESSLEVEQLRAELEELRYRMTDLEERLDFAERMLARQRDAGQLPAGG